MDKKFFASVVIGILVLIIFSYFIFGLNGSAPTATTPQVVPSQPADTGGKLQITDEKIGTGAAVKKGDTVEMNYVGTLTNGTKFDATTPGKPFETQIGVGQVIKGWDEGVIGMKVGGKRKLVIPPSLGYGSQANGAIPGNSTLIFQLELVGIKK
ncbi:MAG TPA: FKBP-type peptidyl-prolyl cis-trans isomerase [Candidatus Acidoferrales bacterium]|nr:FKBP-type peptidyl-prolyl cis-trans isomerase [Candidatus Acidoferrales bacterium]